MKNLAHLKQDIPAGIVVFLVALPLCLGIAMASEAPLFAGVITGVIGGIVVSLLSGAQLSVSGPGNGITVIVAAAIHQLGSYEAFLCAVVIGGFFQLLLGLARAGSLAGYFPNAVIQGMLAAIGLTIILKQIPHALGGMPHFEDELAFLDFVPQHNTIGHIINAVISMSPSAVTISLVSIALLRLWDSQKVKGSMLSLVPGPLVVVFLGVLLNQLFHTQFPGMALLAEDGHLVQLPRITGFSSLLSELRSPNFSFFLSKDAWIVGITIAMICSIETLLSIESTDKMDPLKRVSNNNRELLAQGTGNILAGLLGGIPMTSVIVRSSANIYAGARTRWACFVHGVILLVAALAISDLLNMIPIASLAAVLIHVGSKLASPSIFRKVYREGLNQFAPFMFTMVAVIFTDLLKGVVLGLIVGLGFVIKTSYYSAITVVRDKRDFLIRFSKDVTFVHKVKLKNVLRLLPNDTKVIIDATHAMFIDHDIYEMVKDFVESAPRRNISVELRNMEHKRFQFIKPKARKVSDAIGSTAHTR